MPHTGQFTYLHQEYLVKSSLAAVLGVTLRIHGKQVHESREDFGLHLGVTHNIRTICFTHHTIPLGVAWRETSSYMT